MSACLTGVAAVVRAQYQHLSGRDAEEIAADAIAALFEAAQARREVNDAAAWMIGLARNAAYDRWKALQRTAPVEDPQAEVALPADAEHAVNRLIDAVGDRQVVVAAIGAAVDAGDLTVVRVVMTWLDIHEATGEVPSVRRVGRRAEVPHSTVAKALSRFERYLRQATDG